ncbi:MAG: alcohol dehydrogenase [Cryomorphaceae bacterium]|nr:MAG: alcohol dehydrogenase [Cryomorphaceae bacterium]
MKAIFLTQYGAAEKAFEIRETPDPEMKDRQVTVAVEGFGLNFADVMARNGLYREAPPLPCILGYEVVGRVEKTGADVDPSWVGKRVLAFTRFGGYAEKVVTDHRGLVPIPDELDIDRATTLGTQYATAYYAIMHCRELLPGDTVLVHAAAGGVGLALVQLARHFGCKVIGTAGSPEKIEFLKKQGVDCAINYRAEDYAVAMAKWLNGTRLSATFNALAGSTIKKDYNLLGSGGTLVCFGAATRMGSKGGVFANLKLLLQTGFYSPLFMMMKSKSVVGVNMLKLADNRPDVVQHCLNRVMELYVEGAINPVSGQILPAEKIADAHRALEGRSSIGKVAVRW